MKIAKHMLLFALAGTMLFTSAHAELEESALTDGLSCSVQLDSNGIDTVIRPDNQPYIAECDDSHELIAYVDFVEMPNMNGTYLRLTFSLISSEMTDIDTLRIDSAADCWIFDTTHAIDEYDDTYYEDFSVVLDADGMTLMKAMAQKDLPLTITLEGETDYVTASILFPSDDMKQLYDRFVDAGGMNQSLFSAE